MGDLKEEGQQLWQQEDPGHDLLTRRPGPHLADVEGWAAVPREDNILATTVLASRLLRTHCGAQPWVGKRVIRREFMSRPFYPHIL